MTLSDFNAALHESSIYNVAQTTIASVAVFTGGMNSGFNKAANSAGVKPSCFVAGTLVMAVAGMVAIEKIKSGDKVISTDPETFETAEKTVLETYIREDSKLIHLVINGEEVVTTETHPFYVNDRGFVNAGELAIGDELLDVTGNILLVENFAIELTEKPVTVYNFQVEDFHTYFVGECGVWVHNACTREQLAKNSSDGKKAQELRHQKLLKEHPETKQEITIKPFDNDGNLVDYNVRVDEITNDFFNEVKSSDTAPYTKNQKNGYKLLQRNGGMIRGKGKDGFLGGTILGPLKGYTTRNGITRSILDDMNLIGGN